MPLGRRSGQRPSRPYRSSSVHLDPFGYLTSILLGQGLVWVLPQWHPEGIHSFG